MKNTCHFHDKSTCILESFSKPTVFVLQYLTTMCQMHKCDICSHQYEGHKAHMPERKLWDNHNQTMLYTEGTRSFTCEN